MPLTDDMRQQADKFKNQGNEFVKQEKYKQALEAYNSAIQIDPNNSIYYCNRLVFNSNSDVFLLTECHRYNQKIDTIKFYSRKTCPLT